MDNKRVQGLQKLTGSRVRAKLLTHFVLHPSQEVHVRELARLLGEYHHAVRKELGNLEAVGLLESSQRGRARLFRINRDHYLVPELRGLVLKTAGLGEVLRQAMVELGDVEEAFVYGSAASGEERGRSDIDLMIIGAPNEEELHSRLDKLEGEIQRPINVTIFARDEWEARIRDQQPFAVDVMSKPRIHLIGLSHVHSGS